jgi:hypothetical protein
MRELILYLVLFGLLAEESAAAIRQKPGLPDVHGE